VLEHRYRAIERERKMRQSVAGEINLNKVRSITQVHCAWSVKVLLSAHAVCRARSADNAANGASAFDHNKYAIDRTNRD
jgi:hypothetical protein